MAAKSPARSSRPAAAVTVTPAPDWLRWAILAAVALVLVAWFSPAFQDHDAWWHLETGRYLVQTHKLPAPDPFAYTTYIGKPSYQGEPFTRYFNLTHEWLAQAVIYLAFAAGGFPLVVFLRALLMAATSGLVGYIACRRTGSLYLGAGAALLSATISYSFAYDRPLLVSFLMVAAVMAIAESRRWLWSLPALFIIWSNCHGGFFLGWIVLGAYVLESLLRRERNWQLWGATAASILASGLNPNGFGVFATLLYYRHSYMQSMLVEWHTAPLWPPSPFVAIALAALVLLAVARRQARIVDWLLVVAFAFAGAYALRNVLYMAIVGPIAIASCLPWKPKVLPTKWALVALVLIVASVAWPISRKRAFHFESWEVTRPTGAVNFLVQHHVTGPIYNTYEQGGYLMWKLWPQLKVFVDGRALNEQIFKDYRRIAYSLGGPDGKSPFQLLDQYGVQAIIINGFEYFAGGPRFVILGLADPKQTTWKLVYQDAQGMVFMRQPPPGVTPLPNIAALTSMEAGCAAHIGLVPDEPLCARETCKIFEHLGDWAHARAWMAYYLEHKTGPDPAAETEYQRLAAQKP